MAIFPLFFRCFGPKCGGCGSGIIPQDYVRKARDKVYHLRCFTCSVCSKQLSTGEVLYLQPGEETLLCKDDYLKNHTGAGGGQTGRNLEFNWRRNNGERFKSLLLIHA